MLGDQNTLKGIMNEYMGAYWNYESIRTVKIILRYALQILFHGVAILCFGSMIIHPPISQSKLQFYIKGFVKNFGMIALKIMK